MKLKKVYIGIAAITVSLIIVIASIFYIKANQKDVEISKFEENVSNENTKEAMRETNEDANEENEEEATDENEEEQQDEEEEEEERQEEQEKEEKPKKEIEITQASGTKYVTADSLNVRSGPETSYSRIGSLTFGSEVDITGESGIWYRISYNGGVGFVRGDYLSDDKPEPKPQVEESYNEDDDDNDEDESESGSETISHLIIINSRNNTLRYYRSGSLVGSYSCATGTSGTPTPQGKFEIFEKLQNRPYYKYNIAGYDKDPSNPLGPRWMQFKSGGYAIHGTNNDSSIGTHASHGCVRMHNSEVIELYSMVPYGTTVIVKNTSASDKSIAASYGIDIE
ncbi:MAG: L,D-transpeptidase family protein [Clostridia bacterium]|nr:L,D-transpeptidase family protein [Clostridia bacterium]